jgi:hypothetical protein
MKTPSPPQGLHLCNQITKVVPRVTAQNNANGSHGAASSMDNATMSLGGHARAACRPHRPAP